MASRPNIVFAFADDWGRYASVYAGGAHADPLNKRVQTPNIDRLARDGVLFTNAFVPAPSCTPCRSSVLSGRYFWECGRGAILQGALWDESIPTYPLLLEKAGYHIGYTYKAWAPGEPVNAPYGGERTRYMSAGHNFDSFSQVATKLVPQRGVEGAKQVLYDETRRNFDEFLAARPDGKPFCYWWGPTNTHRAWERGSGKNLWGIDPDSLQGCLPDFLPDVHAVREDVADYLGECQAVDGGLGVLLRRLEEIGELENTLVVVSGDHGIPGMPRAKCNLYDIGCEVALAAYWPGRIHPGRRVDDFVNLMDLAPTFLEAGGVEPPACMSGHSLMPLLDHSASGRLDPARDCVVTGRERHVAAARAGGLPYPQRAIRTDDFLYVVNFAPERWPMGDPCGLDDPDRESPSQEELASNTFCAYADLDASPTKAWMVHNRARVDVRNAFELGFGKRPAEELYDLRSDPHYMQNRAADDALAAIKAELRRKMFDVLSENGDPRVNEIPCRFERPPYAGPLPH